MTALGIVVVYTMHHSRCNQQYNVCEGVAVYCELLLVWLRGGGEHGGQGERRKGDESQADGGRHGVREDVEYGGSHAEGDGESRRRRRDEQVRHHLVAGEIREAATRSPGGGGAHPAEATGGLRGGVGAGERGGPQEAPVLRVARELHPVAVAAGRDERDGHERHDRRGRAQQQQDPVQRPRSRRLLLLVVVVVVARRRGGRPGGGGGGDHAAVSAVVGIVGRRRLVVNRVARRRRRRRLGDVVRGGAAGGGFGRGGHRHDVQVHAFLAGKQMLHTEGQLNVTINEESGDGWRANRVLLLLMAAFLAFFGPLCTALRCVAC